MFYSLKNLSASEVTELPEPWSVNVSAYPFHYTKEQYQAHYRKKTTEHCLISAVEGLSKFLRVKDGTKASGNPPKRIHGFIADYDGLFVPELLEKAKEEPPTPYMPTWACETHSHKLRLVWVFETPVTVPDQSYADAFLKEVGRNLQAQKWAADLDPASYKSAQYFDIGRRWTKQNDYVIPTRLLQLWDFELMKRWIRSHEPNVTAIPFDVVQDEMNSRFPGRHTGPVAEGAPCLRFWAPESDNTTGCVIHSWGVRVFVPRDKPMMYWKDIFGKAFVDEYKSVKTSPVVNSFFFFTKKQEFWRFSVSQNKYFPLNLTHTQKTLVGESGLSIKAPGPTELSEVDQAIQYIVNNRHVDSVVPLLYNPHGILRRNCAQGLILNTSMTRVIEPGEPFTDPDSATSWDCTELLMKCPVIYPYIVALMCETADEYVEWRKSKLPYSKRNLQLNLLLSWLKYFYVNSLALTPKQGHALCLVGVPGTGKSCFVTGLLSPLMGGHTDAKNFFISNEKFSSSVSSSPVLEISDADCSHDYKVRMAYSNRVKGVVANGCLRHEAKFGDAMEALPWLGRIVITANNNAHAITAIPPVDTDTMDKFIFLKTGPVFTDALVDGRVSENNAAIRSDLPAFARFLTYYKVPEELASKPRFGFAAWQHPDILRATASNVSANVVLEALSLIFTDDYIKAAETNGSFSWTGSSSELLQKIQAVSPSIAREIGDSRMLTRNLEMLERAGFKLKSSLRGKIIVWVVDNRIALD